MYAVCDVETTGGSPAVDRITEIALVVYDGEKEVHRFSSLVNPQRKIDKYVTQLTGITDAMVQEAPTFAELASQIHDITHDKIFVAHNVKFDYNLVRSEFKRIGVDFIRKQLDTVTLAQKVLPGFSSYSLGVLCDALGIVVQNRHRAMGDTEATVKLFDLILKQSDAQRHIEIELNHGIDPSILPPHISVAELEKLPEEPGIFYLKDAADKLLLIEPSKNMRREAVKFFNKAVNNAARVEAQRPITQIDFIATGHELVAKLRAHEEIIRHVPQFNKKPREARFTHGLFLQPDADGFLQLSVLKFTETQAEPKLRFSGRTTATKVLAKVVEEGHLQVQFNLLQKMTDPEQRKNFQRAYNEKVSKAVRGILYHHENFFVIAEGRRPDEHSVVWVDGSVFRGTGFITPELQPVTTENLKACIKHQTDDLETQKIIRQELRKGKGLRVVSY